MPIGIWTPFLEKLQNKNLQCHIRRSKWYLKFAGIIAITKARL